MSKIGNFFKHFVPWRQRPTLQAPPPKYLSLMSKAKGKTGWAKALVFQKNKTTTILVNAAARKVLCWGQKIGDNFHWIPVEFKTEEAAKQFLNDGSTLSDLKREIGAPVEWRTEFIGPIPAADPPINEGVTAHSITGAPAAGTP